MAVNVATLVAKLVADTSQFRAGLKQADTAVTKTKSGLASAFGKGALATAGIAALGTAVNMVADEMMATEKATAQTNAVLKSTGGVAKVTASEVENLAKKISEKSGLDDQAIQSASNLLLTFKNVRNEVGKGADIFNRATKAAVDLSVAGFGDMASTAKQLGKALNDPIKGIQALNRAGVTFSQKQKDTIKSLVESGDLLRAQQIILKEVESQVGGSAEAYGKTLPGALGRMKEAFLDAGVSIGKIFTPALEAGARAATEFSRFLQPVTDLLSKDTGKAGGIGKVIFEAGKAMGVFEGGTHSLEKWNQAHKRGEVFVDGHAGAIRNLRNESRALINDQLGLSGALLNVEQSQRTYNDAVKQYGADSLEARQGAQGLAQDILSAAAAAREHGGGVKAEIDTLNFLKGMLTGPLRDAIDQHIAKLMGIPGAVSTTVSVDTAEAEAALLRLLALVNQPYNVSVTAGFGAGFGDIAAVLSNR